MPKPKKIDVNKGQLYDGIYTGSVNIHNLPKDLYHQTAFNFKTGIYKGYGKPLAKFDIDSPDYKLLEDLRTNVYLFSGAKTATQVEQMRGAMVEGEKIIPFKEFKEKADGIFDQYNENWLQAEYETSIGMARNAARWEQVQKHKETLPWLRYIAVMDNHTCEICAPLNGITLSVDDPFWDTNMPENHFRCNCVTESIDKYDEPDISSEEEVQKAVTESSIIKSKQFDFNPGKERAVFKEDGRGKHPYFDIASKYPDLAKKNWGLDIPEKD